jgi:hypothetical protein
MAKTFFLCGVNFIESRNEVVVEFSNGFHRIQKPFEFFPSFLVSLKGIEKKLFNSFLNIFSPNSLLIEKPNKENLRVSSLCFKELKKFHSFVVSSLKLETLFLEPERQFLLEKNWS